METSRALQTPQARWDPTQSLRWLLSNLVLAIGLVLILAQMWWKAGLLGRSYFRLDDYYSLERASSMRLSWSYLLWMNSGHLNVAGAAMAWVIARISPYNWTLASAVTVVLLGCTCFALLRMLRTLFGDRPGILLLLLLYMLSPLSLPGLSWWTVSLEQLPLQLAVFCAVAAHVRYLQTRRHWHAIASAAWLAVAMLSDFRGAATLLLLFTITSAFFAPGTWSRAGWRALREHWPVWVLYAALTAAYLSLYIILLRASLVSTGKSPTVTDTLTYAGTLLRKAFLPGAFGGPWRWSLPGVHALADPPAALIWMSIAAAVVVILMSLMYTWRAWRAWALLAGWIIVVDIAPVVAGRASLVPTAVLGMTTRYAWDATGILALCVGLAFLPLIGGAGPQRPPRRLSRPEFAATTTLIAAIIIGSLWSFYDFPADPAAAAARGYIATARLAMADAPRGTVIIDAPVPADVTGGLRGTVDSASSVLSPLLAGVPAGRFQFITQPDGSYDHLLEFNGFGQLVPAGAFGAASPALPAGESCWPSSPDSVEVLLGPATSSASTLQIGYLAPASGQVLITFGRQSVLFNVQAGLHNAYLPVSGRADTVIIQEVSGPLPCIGNAEAGVLLPAPTGPAIPPLAVAG